VLLDAQTPAKTLDVRLTNLTRARSSLGVILGKPPVDAVMRRRHVGALA
jgi:hypothetical protein